MKNERVFLGKFRINSGVLQVARGGSGAEDPPLATRPRLPPRDLGVRGASIVRCGLWCLVCLNSDLYRICGPLHGLDTF